MMPPPLCQIAFSVVDLRRTHRWYQDVLGFLPSGGTRLFRGPLASRVQGLPRAASTCWWLMDQQEFFQLELFQFDSPRARPRPTDWRACDVGYTTVGIHAVDFDATLARAGGAGVRPLTAPIGTRGQRRVCIRDPEGALLELMEDDPRAPQAPRRTRLDVPVVARSITLSVPDLERSRRFFVDTLGLVPAAGIELHRAEHELLWGLAGAQRRALPLWAGDALVELVQYTDPVGKPWPPGYRISDQGLLNIALGFRNKADFDARYARAIAAGYRGNWRPLNLGAWAVVYLNDDQAFSVELLCVQPWYDRPMGFRAPRAIVMRTRIAAPRERVWAQLSDHERMTDWSPLRRVTLVRPGSPERNGLGAVRRMEGGGLTLEEEVVSWAPPARYDYRVRRGAPIRDHAGCVRLLADGDATAVEWTIRFRPLVPGTGRVLRRALRRTIDDMLARLKQRLETKA